MVIFLFLASAVVSFLFIGFAVKFGVTRALEDFESKVVNKYVIEVKNEYLD